MLSSIIHLRSQESTCLCCDVSQVQAAQAACAAQELAAATEEAVGKMSTASILT